MVNARPISKTFRRRTGLLADGCSCATWRASRTAPTSSHIALATAAHRLHAAHQARRRSTLDVGERDQRGAAESALVRRRHQDRFRVSTIDLRDGLDPAWSREGRLVAALTVYRAPVPRALRRRLIGVITIPFRVLVRRRRLTSSSGKTIITSDISAGSRSQSESSSTEGDGWPSRHQHPLGGTDIRARRVDAIAK